jgi:hypothetical protein
VVPSAGDSGQLDDEVNFMKKPPIGVPRVYDTHELPILYPGERASAQLTPMDFRRAVRHGDVVEVELSGWIVEPAPGWHARWLRIRYRIFGRWFSVGAPKLVVSASMREGDNEPTVDPANKRAT